MAKYKVKDEDLKELAKVYNAKGKKAVYGLLGTQYHVKNPYFVLRRMRDHPGLAYDPDGDAFTIEGPKGAEGVFMSMEELCPPVIPHHTSKEGQHENDSRPAAMDRLIRELIGERLLELSKYVTIDSLSKRIIVDKTTLTIDGYRLITH